MLEARGGGRVVALPFAAKLVLDRARAPVRVTVNGHTFRTTTMRYGGVDHVGLNREVRDAAGVADGDVLELTIAPDDGPRVVEIPAELGASVGGAPDARARFDALSYTHRKEYARSVSEAKRVETRLRRAERAIELLRGGVRTPDAPR